MDMVIHQCQQLWSDCIYLHKALQEEPAELEDVEEEEGEEEEEEEEEDPVKLVIADLAS
jgi:hypothetical protein